MKRLPLLILFVVIFLTACTQVEDDPVLDCNLTPNHIDCIDDPVDCQVTPEHEDCVEEPVDCDATPEHEDCVEEPVDCDVTPEHEDCVEEPVDCDITPEHEDCVEEPVDCDITPEHEDCIEEPVDCDVTPEHQDCIEVSPPSCEVTEIDNCLFTLSIANSDGTFTTIATYETMSDADLVMENYDNINAVVLFDEEVVAMRYGAVNFDTKSSSQITILAHLGFRFPTYLNGSYNTDGLFLDTNGIFTRGIVAGVYFEVLTNEIELIPHNQTNNGYSYYSNVDGELVHTITNDIRSRAFYAMDAMDIAPTFMNSGTKYYSYDGHYFYTDIFTMTDDHNDRSYDQAVNADNPYYNYYQYISFRSLTNYTAAELNSYIANHTNSSSVLYDSADQFISAGETVYVNAALELSFAIHESGWGQSAIARDKNNLFGINAIDSDPYNNATTFDSIEDCIIFHIESTLQTRYFNPTYWVSFGTNVGNKYQGMNYKYASDAYWGEKIAKHYYRMDKELGFKDRHSYQIILLEPNAIGTYGPQAQSPVIYDSSSYNYYGLRIPFILRDETEDFYVLQLPLPLDENLVMDPFGRMTPTDVFYVSKEYGTKLYEEEPV